MNRAEFNVAVRVNFERKEGESELAAYTRAFDAAMRQIGKSAQEVDVFHKLAADVEAGKVSLSELSAENVELLRIWREMSQEAADKDLLGLRAHQEIQEEIDATREAYARLQASGKLTEAELAQAALRTEERVRELEKSTNGWADAMFKAKGKGRKIYRKCRYTHYRRHFFGGVSGRRPGTILQRQQACIGQSFRDIAGSVCGSCDT